MSCMTSVRFIQFYKSVIEQGPGFRPHEGYSGGIVLDEMSIQEDIQLDNKGGKWKFSGTSDNSWDILKTGENVLLGM